MKASSQNVKENVKINFLESVITSSALSASAKLTQLVRNIFQNTNFRKKKEQSYENKT